MNVVIQWSLNRLEEGKGFDRTIYIKWEEVVPISQDFSFKTKRDEYRNESYEFFKDVKIKQITTSVSKDSKSYDEYEEKRRNLRREPKPRSTKSKVPKATHDSITGAAYLILGDDW